VPVKGEVEAAGARRRATNDIGSDCGVGRSERIMAPLEGLRVVEVALGVSAVGAGLAGRLPGRLLPVPGLGEHTAQVLDSLGFGAGQRAALAASGTVKEVW
jgi:hypothetical protein